MVNRWKTVKRLLPRATKKFMIFYTLSIVGILLAMAGIYLAEIPTGDLSIAIGVGIIVLSGSLIWEGVSGVGDELANQIKEDINNNDEDDAT